MADVLSRKRLEDVLARIPALTVGVLGDLFLDRYLDLDAALTEPSIETGLDAYQVTRVRSYPGAAGTVVNNLAALGVGAVVPVAVIGDDGEGHELWQALQALPAVRLDHVARGRFADFRTPTYTKPMLHQAGQAARELNRLDVKNRRPLTEMDRLVLPALEAAWPGLDALLVVDQVSEPDCGVVTGAVRAALARLGQDQPGKVILADSRERVGLFRNVWLKPNAAECARAAGDPAALARRCGRPVFCTRGERGMIVVDPRTDPATVAEVPACRVDGPIDVVGAGDSTSAALACALAVGATLVEAAAFGNLVASITIQQIGVTGTATPEQVRERWRDCNSTPHQ